MGFPRLPNFRTTEPFTPTPGEQWHNVSTAARRACISTNALDAAIKRGDVRGVIETKQGHRRYCVIPASEIERLRATVLAARAKADPAQPTLADTEAAASPSQLDGIFAVLGVLNANIVSLVALSEGMNDRIDRGNALLARIAAATEEIAAPARPARAGGATAALLLTDAAAANGGAHA